MALGSGVIPMEVLVLESFDNELAESGMRLSDDGRQLALHAITKSTLSLSVLRDIFVRKALTESIDG